MNGIKIQKGKFYCAIYQGVVATSLMLTLITIHICSFEYCNRSSILFSLSPVFGSGFDFDFLAFRDMCVHFHSQTTQKKTIRNRSKSFEFIRHQRPCTLCFRLSFVWLVGIKLKTLFFFFDGRMNLKQFVVVEMF